MAKFRAEKITSMLEEAKPLVHEHFKEVMAGIETTCEPNYDQYIQLEELGITRSYSARTEDGILIGYAVFLLQPSLFSKNISQALQILLFVAKNHRGLGYFFIKYCDGVLKHEGINMVQHQIPVKRDCGPMLEAMGYEKIQSVYSKRLN